MRKKRKQSVARRPRRSPYQRSLEYATARLEQAISEELECQKRLSELLEEIPYLQGVIRALTPVNQPAVNQIPKEIVTQFATMKLPVNPVEALVKPNSEAVNQEDFLTNFMPGHELLP